MKTINAPSVNCPEWKDDIPLDRVSGWINIVNSVHRAIFASANKSVLTSDEVREWHRMLFRSTVPVDYYAGNYRGVYSQFPCLANDVAVTDGASVHFSGSPYQLTIVYMGQLFDQTRRNLISLELGWARLLPLDRAKRLAIIIAHFIGPFIQIHPFLNGNGRVSRLIWRWCLLRFGVAPQCCTYPRPDPPYAQVMERAMTGDFSPLAFFVLKHLQLHAPQQI